MPRLFSITYWLRSYYSLFFLGPRFSPVPGLLRFSSRSEAWRRQCVHKMTTIIGYHISLDLSSEKCGREKCGRNCLRRAVRVGLKRIVPPFQGSGIGLARVHPGRCPLVPAFCSRWLVTGAKVGRDESGRVKAATSRRTPKGRSRTPVPKRSFRHVVPRRRA
jgi:hypothetical protein